MRISGVIQCRMASSRLPGKALALLNGRCLLEWVIRRSGKASSLSRLILVTTTNKQDDPVAVVGEKYGIEVIRGAEDDVLSRYMSAIEQFPAEAVVRITADNPLVDFQTIDNVASFFKSHAPDYCYAARIPYGAGVDIFCTKALTDLALKKLTDRHREHINTYILDNHLYYRICSFPPLPGQNRPDVRVTVDTLEDLERVKRIFTILKDPENSELENIIQAYDCLYKSDASV